MRKLKLCELTHAGGYQITAGEAAGIACTSSFIAYTAALTFLFTPLLIVSLAAGVACLGILDS